MFTYSAYGLTVGSAIEMPEFRPADGPLDVVIRYGEVQSPPNVEGLPIRAAAPIAGGMLLYWGRAGAFSIQDGGTVTFSPSPDIDEKLLRQLVLGPILGIILAQRGSSVFHASVVRGTNTGHAVAFLGRQGEGKSTTAAALHAEGYHLVSDDLMSLSYDDDGPVVQPAYPNMKLWLESAEVFLDDTRGLDTISADSEKRTVPISDRFATGPTRLGAVFVLETGPDVAIEPLGGTSALAAVLPHWYGAQFDGQLLSILGRERHFREAARLAGSVPVYRLTRPRDLSRLSEVVRAIAGAGSQRVGSLT